MIQSTQNTKHKFRVLLNLTANDFCQCYVAYNTVVNLLRDKLREKKQAIFGLSRNVTLTNS